MSKFTEESLLLIRNYDAYQDIEKAWKHLTPALRSLFPNIKKRLQKESWWKDKWELADQLTYPEAIQFSFCDKINGDGAIWVIIESLTPDRIFGNAESPSMAIWICENEKRKEICEELHEIIKSGSNSWLGDFIKPNSKNPYVLQKNMSTTLPEEIEKLNEKTLAPWLEDLIFAQFAGFSEFYSKYFEQFNMVAIKYSKYNK